MKANTYTNEMTKLAICAAIAALAIALLLPTYAHAKATGDSIGTATKPALTGASHADMADAPSTPANEPSTQNVSKTATAPVIIANGTSTSTATTTQKLTRSEQRAQIKALKAEIKRLQALINAMKK